MNSDAARANAARPSNPARMRQLLATEPNCRYCGDTATIRVPDGKGMGRYMSLCSYHHHSFQPHDPEEASHDLDEMLAEIDRRLAS